MVSLVDITEDNYREVCSLSVAEDQMGFVAPPVSILARAYAKRARNARALAIASDDTIAGVLMFMELHEEPACYAIEQFMIDHRYQNKGIGKQALQLVIGLLAEDGKYAAIEICVKMSASQAISVYKSAGFEDTGYIDPGEPDSFVLRKLICQ